MALTSSSTDAEVLAAFDDNARHWESYTKAANLCEAITIILNRFNRMNTIAGKSWTREDLSQLLKDATESRKAMTPSSGPGARTHFTRGRVRA